MYIYKRLFFKGLGIVSWWDELCLKFEIFQRDRVGSLFEGFEWVRELGFVEIMRSRMDRGSIKKIFRNFLSEYLG